MSHAERYPIPRNSGSGGGFSAMFDQAAWQMEAVAAYVAQNATLPKFPPLNSFPLLGRATPDVAVLGEGFQVFVDGKVVSVSGTSAAAPTFAAIVSLLNEARLGAGKPPMGL
jgi:tripeptidyl-peptidase I